MRVRFAGVVFDVIWLLHPLQHEFGQDIWIHVRHHIVLQPFPDMPLCHKYKIHNRRSSTHWLPKWMMGLPLSAWCHVESSTTKKGTRSQTDAPNFNKVACNEKKLPTWAAPLRWWITDSTCRFHLSVVDRARNFLLMSVGFPLSLLASISPAIAT